MPPHEERAAACCPPSGYHGNPHVEPEAIAVEIPTILQNWPLQALAATVAGVVVLLAPRVLNYAVAAYLLLVGVLGLLHYLYGQPLRAQGVIALVAGVLILIRPTILNYVVGIYLIVIGLLEAGIVRL